VRLPAAVVTALLLCGCEVYAVPSPIACPADRQGTFDFVASRVYLQTDCFFTQPGGQANDPISFPGTVSFLPGTNDALLCVDRPHALPNAGTYSGVSIDVASVFAVSVGGCTCPSAEAAAASKCGCPPDSPSSNCSCQVLLEQRIQADLTPIPGGGYSGLTGSLVNTVNPPPGTDPAQLCNCQQTCTYSYDLAATVVGSR
jgi:hypothetical protein